MKSGLCFILFVAFTAAFPPQTSRFPVGLFAITDTAAAVIDGYTQIDSMDPNWIAQNAKQSGKTPLPKFNLIACNPNDYLLKFAAGYLKKWEAEENTFDIKKPGIKHDIGFSDIQTGSWKSPHPSNDTTQINRLLVHGPDYYQNRCYRLRYNNNPIAYNVRFRMKIDGNTTKKVPVCEIIIKYKTASAIAVLADTILYATQLANSFTETTLSYTLPRCIGTDTLDKNNINGLPIYSGSKNIAQDTAFGVSYNIKWLGSRTLYVDYIQVFDALMGLELLQFRQIVASYINSYLANCNNLNNIKYWYRLDGHHSIDNYEPYRIVDSIINAHRKISGADTVRSITIMYPEWNGKRDNENTLPRFKNEAQPQRMMYYYNNTNGTRRYYGISRNGYYPKTNLWFQK